MCGRVRLHVRCVFYIGLRVYIKPLKCACVTLKLNKLKSRSSRTSSKNRNQFCVPSSPYQTLSCSLSFSAPAYKSRFLIALPPYGPPYVALLFPSVHIPLIPFLLCSLMCIITKFL